MAKLSFLEERCPRKAVLLISIFLEAHIKSTFDNGIDRKTSLCISSMASVLLYKLEILHRIGLENWERKMDNEIVSSRKAGP